MKTRIAQFFLAALLLGFVACNNQESEAEKPAPAPETAKPAATTPKPADPKTEVSVGPGGAEVKTSDVKVKVATKDSAR